MGAGGRQTVGSPSQVQPDVYNRFQSAVMEQQEAAGSRNEGMAGPDAYSAQMGNIQDAMVEAGGARTEGMAGGANAPNMPGNMENAVVEQSGANNAGMGGMEEMLERLRAEQAGQGKPREGIDMGPGRATRG